MLLLFNRVTAFAQMYPARQYTTEDELANSNIYDICHDERGYLWFATDRGLSRFDGYKFTNYLFKEGLQGAVVYGLTQDKNGKLYAATKNDGIYRLDWDFTKVIDEHASLTNEEIVISDSYLYSLRVKVRITVAQMGKAVYHKITFPSKDIIPLCLFKDPSGAVYVGTTKGIYLLNGIGSVKKVFNEITRPIYSISKHADNWFFGAENMIYKKSAEGYSTIQIPDIGNINNLLIDKNATIWGSTFPQNKCFQIINNEILDITTKLNLQGVSVNEIMEDREGNIWLGTYGKGAFCIHHMYCNNYTALDGLNNEYVTAIESQSNGNLFIGTNNGLYNLDNEGLHFTKQFGNALEYIKDLEDRNDSIWVTLSGLKVNKLDAGKAVIGNTNAIFSYASATLIDGDDLYYSRWNKRLYRTSSKTMSEADAELILFDSTAIWSRINKIFKDKNENIWLGTTRGLYIIEPNGLYQKMDTGYFKTNISTFLYDGEGALLIGSDKGLIKYKNKKWSISKEGKGKSLETITSLTLDNKKRVWIGTLNGLYLLDDKNLLKIDTKNTLLSDEINAIEYDITKNYLWVGTTFGLSSINLTLFDKTPVNPPVAIFKTLRSKDSVYRVSDSINEIVLPYTESNFAVRFSAVHFSSPDGIKFLYKFDNNKWQPAIGRQIEFATMPYGKHTLLLKSIGEKDIEGPVASIYIIVERPFWATIWFKIVIGVTIGVIAYLILKKRFEIVRQKQQERLELQTKIAELRHQALAASMNPHFIFNALNSIQHFINSHNTEEATDYLAKFARLIRMMLDLGDKTFIPLKDELERINYYLELEKIRFGDKLTFTIDIDPQLLNEQQEIPNMVIQPVVENALWHGLLPANRNGHLKIAFTKIGNSMRVIVDDDGIGVTESKRRKKSNHNSLGIKMIRERLDLLKRLSGYEAKINVMDKSEFNPPTQGTLVQINLG